MSGRSNGGFCWANCSVTNGYRANPIEEKRSSILYILDITPRAGKEVVLDVFQFHSDEYAARYRTTHLINNKHHQCIRKTSQLLLSKTVKELVENCRKWDYETITGDTEENLKLLERSYVISSKATTTIQRIRRFNSHAEEVDFDKKTLANNNNIYYMDLFLKSYERLKKYKKSTKIKFTGNTYQTLTITLNSSEKYIFDRYILDTIQECSITAKILYQYFNKLLAAKVIRNSKRMI